MYEISAYSRGKILLAITNYGNESLNYSFFVVYRMFRGIMLKNKLPSTISENGTVNANSTLEKTYDVKFSFSPIVAVLTVGNNSLVCTGFVFGKRVIFRAMAVINEPIAW